MSDRLTSWLRTVVPALWAALVAWLVTLGVPTAVTDALSGLGELVLVPLALAAVYSALRWIEPHLPAWLTALLLGSNAQPRYGDVSAEELADAVARELAAQGRPTTGPGSGAGS
jgi:hypothetical protein